jgi:3-hydroxyacyl-[acyl-carrier-protein] dehydratase
MRYYLLDKVTALVAGERASGVKCVTLSDEILHDHFPDYPMLPGALIVEAAAQLSGFLLELSFNAPDKPLVRAMLVQIERAKFYDPIAPGDTLALEARSSRRGFTSSAATCTRCGREICRRRWCCHDGDLSQ